MPFDLSKLKTGTTPPIKTFTDADESSSSDSLKNTGKLKGEKVIEMYFKNEIGSVSRPEK